jgi:hypothetical protein
VGGEAIVGLLLLPCDVGGRGEVSIFSVISLVVEGCGGEEGGVSIMFFLERRLLLLREYNKLKRGVRLDLFANNENRSGRDLNQPTALSS